MEQEGGMSGCMELRGKKVSMHYADSLTGKYVVLFRDGPFLNGTRRAAKILGTVVEGPYKRLLYRLYEGKGKGVDKKGRYDYSQEVTVFGTRKAAEAEIRRTDRLAARMAKENGVEKEKKGRVKA